MITKKGISDTTQEKCREEVACAVTLWHKQQLCGFSNLERPNLGFTPHGTTVYLTTGVLLRIFGNVISIQPS